MNEGYDALAGCLLGIAVGDATGLCCEGLSRRRQAVLFRHLNGPQLLGRMGMVSDDTDHARMTVQAMIEAGGDSEAFLNALARAMRRWLLCVPPGVGLATLRSGVRLLAGADPSCSGVFSADNGPAMRAPVIGVAWGHDAATMRRLIRASTRLTHTDPKAEWGALAVALAASMACRTRRDLQPSEYSAALADLLPPEECLSLVAAACESASRGENAAAFCDGAGMPHGVSGYTYQTVPAVIQTWLRHQTDVRAGILEIIRCGGDTDTTSAILGGIVGARVGRDGIPPDWPARIFDPAYPPAALDALAWQLAEVSNSGIAQCARARGPLPLLGRNAILLALVIAHGLRRLLPPYA